MITFENVKLIFSKAFITADTNKIHVRYISTADNKWVTQCFPAEDNSKYLFEAILDSSDEFNIAISSDSGVVLEFLSNGELLNTFGKCSCYPVAHNMTPKELAEFEKRHHEEFLHKEIAFAEKFIGVDMEADEAVLKRINEIIYNKKSDDNLINFQAHYRWINLCQKAIEFSEKYDLGSVDTMSPDSSFSGGVTLSASIDDGRRTWIFSKEAKNAFLNLIKTSVEFSIECGLSDSSEEVLSISFYS